MFEHTKSASNVDTHKTVFITRVKAWVTPILHGNLYIVDKVPWIKTLGHVHDGIVRSFGRDIFNILGSSTYL